MKHLNSIFYIIILIAISLIAIPYPQSTSFVDKVFTVTGLNTAATFLQQTVTVKQLRDKYNAPVTRKVAPKIRIMIVPGHEPDYGGAEYGDLKERDMVVAISNYLADFLRNNSHYEVVVARDQYKWNPVLEDYFKNNWDDIKSFIQTNKNEMVRLMSSNVISKKTDGIYHNKAPENVATRLYGINKWNNENHIDMAIHVHINDYPRKRTNVAGEYSGFAIYVPEKQYSSSETTKEIANAVFNRLGKYNPVSNLPKEGDGVIEEQELIATGAYNTVDAPSMLIEYGYIYEPQFADPEIRDFTFKDLAFQTYLGIQDFFGSGNDVSFAFDTLMLPYSWIGDISKDNGTSGEVFALQTAFLLDGVYPPKDRAKNDCPRSGKFGPCTEKALNDFQIKHGIEGEKGIVGEKTRAVLNSEFSPILR